MLANQNIMGIKFCTQNDRPPFSGTGKPIRWERSRWEASDKDSARRLGESPTERERLSQDVYPATRRRHGRVRRRTDLSRGELLQDGEDVLVRRLPDEL